MRRSAKSPVSGEPQSPRRETPTEDCDLKGKGSEPIASQVLLFALSDCIVNESMKLGNARALFFSVNFFVLADHEWI